MTTRPAASPFEVERTRKIPSRYAYFNINVLWSQPHMKIVEWLYPLPVRPEAVVFVSVVCGLVSAWLYSSGGYSHAAAGAGFLYLKNLFDTVDGKLARARGQVTRLGRFLDSLGDLVVSVSVLAGVACGLQRAGASPWLVRMSAVACLSLVFQASYFNYYQVVYVRRVNSLSQLSNFPARTREVRLPDDSRAVRFLRGLYVLTYGWQDRLMAGLDCLGKRVAARIDEPESFDVSRPGWYNHRAFLAAEAFLCPGTQLAFLIGCTVAHRLDWFVLGMISAWNLYLVALFAWRVLYFRGRTT